MLSDPDAYVGERILPVMLTPPLPANENSPLATTGGGSSVRLGALPIAQIASRHTKHKTLTAMLSRIFNIDTHPPFPRASLGRPFPIPVEIECGGRGVRELTPRGLAPPIGDDHLHRSSRVGRH